MFGHVVGDDRRSAAHRLDQGRMRAADLGRLDVGHGVRLKLRITLAEDISSERDARSLCGDRLE